MTKTLAASKVPHQPARTPVVSVQIGLLLIYEYRVNQLDDVPPFMGACETLAGSVAQERDDLEICWLYGQDPTKPGVIRCLVGFWSLSAEMEFNKSAHWKRFLKTINKLPHETSVQLVEHMEGSVLLHHQLVRRAE